MTTSVPTLNATADAARRAAIRAEEQAMRDDAGCSLATENIIGSVKQALEATQKAKQQAALYKSFSAKVAEECRKLQEAGDTQGVQQLMREVAPLALKQMERTDAALRSSREAIHNVLGANSPYA